MVALMSLTSAAAFAADKTLGFDDLYNNPKAITQAMQESNAQLPVSEAVSADETLTKLNENTKILFVNFLSQNEKYSKAAEHLSKNISNDFMYNKNIFIVGKNVSKGFKIEYASKDNGLIQLAKTADNFNSFYSKGTNRYDPAYDPGPSVVCVKTELQKDCSIKNICEAISEIIAPGAVLATEGLASSGLVGFVGAGIGITLNHLVCRDMEECEDVYKCVEWEHI